MLEVLGEVGSHYGATPAQVALAWLLLDRQVMVIPGLNKNRGGTCMVGLRKRLVVWPRASRVRSQAFNEIIALVDSKKDNQRVDYNVTRRVTISIHTIAPTWSWAYNAFRSQM